MDELEKALRKVRTLAGVKFFGMPIGTVISPGMVKAAREAHGDKKTDDMLLAQRRNTMRDGRRKHFQNQSVVRAKKRAERVENNARAREAKRKDSEIREFMGRQQTVRAMKEPQKALVVPKAVTTPKAATPAATKTDASNKDMERLFDLVHAEGKWDDTQVADAIAIAMKYKAVKDPMIRELLMELVKRLRKEE